MLAELADAVSAEPVLVAPAGGDAAESADLAAAFAAIGVRRLIVTRTDTVRRLGGILASVETARLALSDAGVSPQIADGLVSLNAHRLAGLLLRASGVSEEPAAATGTY
jgi:flagellar biosynthesis protein FlhF